jgi:UDP-N-acetylglucosamine 2-epimerase (non-hydrolysing)
VMIDSLSFYKPMAEKSTVLEDLSLVPGSYGLVTLHRPSNVDDPETLRGILGALSEIGKTCPLVFPAHPRTRKIIENNNIAISPKNIRILDPTGYLDFAKLMMYSRIVLTDSGGIQEETTVLGIPCLTIRENTERPVTIEIGTNRLVGVLPERILEEGMNVLSRGKQERRVPEFWDGKTSQRIVRVINEYL